MAAKTERESGRGKRKDKGIWRKALLGNRSSCGFLLVVSLNCGLRKGAHLQREKKCERPASPE